jgi:hypothetical protein
MRVLHVKSIPVSPWLFSFLYQNRSPCVLRMQEEPIISSKKKSQLGKCDFFPRDAICKITSCPVIHTVKRVHPTLHALVDSR